MSNNGNGHGINSRKRPFGEGRARQFNQYLEPYRRLALQLHYGLPRPDNPRSVLLVTPTASALGAHGSTDLACSMADELRRPILLIDACPRDPEVSRILDCMGSRGFADILSDPGLRPDDFVLPTTHENVSFLPAGAEVASHRPAQPHDMSALLKAAEGRNDFVILSGGSVLNDSLSLALAPYVGCVMLLVIENETKVEDLDAARDALFFCKARQVGLVLTTALRGGADPFVGVANGNGRRVGLN